MQLLFLYSVMKYIICNTLLTAIIIIATAFLTAQAFMLKAHNLFHLHPNPDPILHPEAVRCRSISRSTLIICSNDPVYSFSLFRCKV